ncbi:MAG TPA: hypothetical protein VJM11_15295 [Nevskiaceae bacterium]|nr:hypothetical protein [Nevskiaceae bacterium]
MSHSDFFKELFIAAVGGGLIKPSSDGPEVQHVMGALLQHYVEVAQTVGQMNTALSGRASHQHGTSASST